MKHRAAGLLMLLALTGCAVRATKIGPAPGSAVLDVRFRGMQSDAGALIYALYGDEAGFESNGAALSAGSLAIENGLAEWTVELPRGAYAVKAYHDVNGNGELDRGAFDRPTEPFGFSNDARGRLGPPSWKAASFSLDVPRRRIEIQLR